MCMLELEKYDIKIKRTPDYNIYLEKFFSIG